MYASPEFGALVGWLRELLDSLEGTASEERLHKIFSTSARYEYLFWDMSYRLEVWPI
jgi:thiaminase (transcriptional activator TenA)